MFEAHRPTAMLAFGLITSDSSYDSGSPIIIPGDGTTDHPDILVALVSRGVLCVDPDYPGVNAHVSELSDWIDATVCDTSDNPPVDFLSRITVRHPNRLLQI
jgi:secreted trypsin-like serine protease